MMLTFFLSLLDQSILIMHWWDDSAGQTFFHFSKTLLFSIPIKHISHTSFFTSQFRWKFFLDPLTEELIRTCKMTKKKKKYIYMAEILCLTEFVCFIKNYNKSIDWLFLKTSFFFLMRPIW